jgi:hypothetical protein
MLNANSQANNAAESKSGSTESSNEHNTLEQQRKGRTLRKCCGIEYVSDLMKSKKSDQLTKQFNDATSLKAMEQREFS